MAEAIRYGLRHWERLTRFLDDGRIDIDFNTVERSIRPIALNRKNAFFAGGDDSRAHRRRMVQPRAQRPHAVELPPRLNGLSWTLSPDRGVKRLRSK
jgi:hypothetical protein